MFNFDISPNEAKARPTRPLFCAGKIRNGIVLVGFSFEMTLSPTTGTPTLRPGTVQRNLPSHVRIVRVRQIYG
jgi:hypothetical protein